MSSVLFNRFQDELAATEAAIAQAVGQTPAQARREWNGIVLVGLPDPITAPDRRELRLMGMRPVSSPRERQEVEGQDVRD